MLKSICIITTRHISYNPRVLKEADAFFNKGYQLTVVTINNHSNQHKFDQELMQTRSWKLKTVNFRKEVKDEKLQWFYFSFIQKLYLFLARFSLKSGIAERASLKGFGCLVKMAKQVKADFYLVHHPEALAVGYEAARFHKAKLGFDAEDFHSGMNESGQVSKEETMVAYLEKKYLPHCIYLTAASKGIGDAYKNNYGFKNSEVILNVFPKEETVEARINNPVKFYWYSQTIGPNRSLEILLKASATIKEPFELHLRGSFHSNAYKKVLEDLIGNLNIKDKVFFHPPILAEDIIKDAARFDVGLALESNISINRNICVTNKIFSYLMSGLGIIGTDTMGQKHIFSQFNDAVIVCRMDDAAELSRAMNEFITNREKLINAKRVAKKVAEEQFNWEFESKKLIAILEKNFTSQAKHASFVDS